jgi:TolB-like protein
MMGDGVNIAARLEGIAKPGAICLSEDAFRQVKGRLGLPVTDLGPIQLKNIANPIRVYSVEVAAPAQAKPAPTSAPEKSAAPARLSIVVLPFANIGGDPEQDYFVDGITENLTTDLSRIRGSFVIGRHTAFTYKGKAADLRQIGRELNVRYVLGGSVQRAASRLRVNVQLIDAESGAHLWAERFEKPVADLFDMQDEIVARLANALNVQLVAIEARRAEQAPTPDSMDLYFQGRAWFNKGLTPDNVARARGFFDRALTADPGNVDALAWTAYVDAVASVSSFVSDPQAALTPAEAKLTKALSLAPDHAQAQSVLGFVHILTKRALQGVAECERALELDRNLAHAHSFIGVGKIYVGRAGETEAHIVEALRLSPRDILTHIRMHVAGVAKLYLGRYEEAVAWFRRAIETHRSSPLSHFQLGAALAELGRFAEAGSAVRAGLMINPDFSIARARAAGGALSDDPSYLTQFERNLEGLRKAGVPEQ